MWGWTVKRVVAGALLLLALSGCGIRTSDDERLDRVTVDGQECVVIRNGYGRVIALDCDWSDR